MQPKFTQLALVANPRKKFQRYSSEPRPCSVCGEMMIRRERETACSFAQRKTCSGECRNVRIGQQNSGRVFGYRTGGGNPRKYFEDEKVCPECGVTFYRSENVEPEVFSRKKTCGKPNCVVTTRRRNNPRRVSLPPKPCELCGVMMVQGDERAQSFRYRRTCSQDCRGGLIGKTRKSRNPLRDVVRHCEYCGTVLVQRDNEEFDGYWKRKTCSHDCAISLRSAMAKNRYQAKICVICGKEFTSSLGLHPWTIKRRQTCGGKCAAELAWLNRNRRQSNTGYPPEWNGALRKFIRDRDGNRCSFCGTPNRLAVHHIDYRKHDCRPDNLLTLCVSCHTRTNNGDRSDWYFKCRAILVERGIIVAEELAA